DPVHLRSEAAACLAGVDLRPGTVLAPDFTAAAVAFSPDGAWLAAGQFKAAAFVVPCPVRLLPLAPDRPARTLTFAPALVRDGGKLVQDGVRCLAFSPDGRRLAAGARSGSVHLWDLTE